MKEADQIKAIAEACGWQYHPQYGWTRGSSGVFGCHPSLYLTNLNAMREALKLLETLTWRSIGKADFVHPDVVDLPLYPAYLSKLCSVCGVNHYMRGGEADAWAIVCATPAQQAEAFLRTLGLWKD
jgi:hypothetical protein